MCSQTHIPMFLVAGRAHRTRVFARDQDRGAVWGAEVVDRDCLAGRDLGHRADRDSGHQAGRDLDHRADLDLDHQKVSRSCAKVCRCNPGEQKSEARYLPARAPAISAVEPMI